MLAALNHPNIATIYDVGEVDGRAFLVMELLEGETLEDRRERVGSLPAHEVLSLADRLLDVLGAAHEKGIVHRDIKPENIFLVQRSQGRWGVKVVDFGIAKTPLHPKLTRLKLGETLGSPPFMAPEMIRGDWIRPGATVIDVGINRVPALDPAKAADGKTRLVGDVAFEEARQVAGAVTPVPGGVGPMTITMLLRNTLQAAQEAQGG